MPSTPDLVLLFVLLIFGSAAWALFCVWENRPYQIRDDDPDITPNVVWRRRRP